MTDPGAYIKEIESINRELKRLGDLSKRLREQKKLAQHRLYNYMERRGMCEYGGIKRSSIAPKPSLKRKTQREKMESAMDLFRREGVVDPRALWERLQASRKSS